MVIYGSRPVEELVRNAPHAIREVFVTDTARGGSLGVDAAIRTVDKNELDRITDGGNHQGIAVRVAEFPFSSLDAIIAATEDEPRARVVILDQVQDPQNLGAILRTAAAFGVHGVLIPKDRAATVTPAVVRASAGFAFSVRVARVTNVARALEQLKEAGYWTVGAVVEEGVPPWEIDFDMKTALVVGAEGPGIRRLVAEACDFRVAVPMAAGVDSLNVSVSTGVLLYEIVRPR